MSKGKFPNSEPLMVEPGELSITTQQYLDLAHWDGIDIHNAEEIAQRCDDYFKYCISNDRRPIVQGLCLALGTNRQSLVNWENEDSTRGQVIRTAKQIIRTLLEDWTVSGKISPPCGIFMLKNYAGLRDDHTIEVLQPADYSNRMSPEQIRQAIDEDIPVDQIEASDALPTADIFDLESKRKEVLH